MRLFLHQLAAEQRLFWRSRESAVFTFFLPVLVFLLLGSVYGDHRIEGKRAAPYLLAGMLGYGAVATAFAGLAITLVIRRESGVLKRIRATPLPPAAYLGGVLASTLLVFALEAVLLVGLGRALFHIGIPDPLGSLVLALLLGAAAFAALGLAVTAVVRSAEGSSGVVSAIYLPMAFISGAFFSVDSMPHFLRVVAEVLPLTYLNKLIRGIVLDGRHLWSRPGSIAVIAAWGLAGLALALRRFRWEPREG